MKINKNDNIHKNEVKNIGFGIHIKFPSQRKQNYSNRSINKEIGLLWSRQSFGESTISDLNPYQIYKSKKKKNIQIRPKQRNWTFVVLTVIWRKYNIGF